MAYINDQVFVQGLNYAVANGTVVRLCSQEPTTYAEASATYGLSNGSIALGAPVNGAIDGMRVIIPTTLGCNVTASGTATHWAVTDTSGILVATGLLNTPVALLIATLVDFTQDTDIAIRDAV